MNDTIESELTPAFCHGLWHVLRAALAGVALLGGYLLVLRYGRGRPAEWWLLLAAEVPLAGLAVWLFLNPDARLDDSGLRIMWQLVKGLAAGIVLLAGCVLVFRQRAGIVLLHAGVGLLMCSELWTGITANEAQMTIAEGQTVNFASDIRTTELAVADRSSPDHDRVTVIPASVLADNVGSAGRIEHADLPFGVRVHRWLPNSTLRNLAASDSSPATAGAGLRFAADEARAEVGVDVEQGVDLPAAYVELCSNATGESLGTYLVAASLNEQPIEIDGKDYDLALRFKRVYYPYTLTLQDFRFDRYTGTNTPKNFSSLVRLQDAAQNVDREVPIWMNNPLRYAGTTFYQADWDERTEQGTVLQVVKNPGWMAPYVACMLVMTGMLAHFGITLTRFLERSARPANMPLPAGRTEAWSAVARWGFPVLVVALLAGYVASKARLPHDGPSQMQVHEFGKLPLAYQGRVKPCDTVARNLLQIFSGRQELIAGKKKQPAIVWLLDAISDSPAAADHRVFRIDNLELVETLGLEPRELSWRYSINEIRGKFDELQKQIDLAAAQPEGQRSPFQQAVLQLAGKLNRYVTLVKSFRSPAIEADREKFLASVQSVQAEIQGLQQAEAPQSVPPTAPLGHWTTLMEAEFQLLQDSALERPVNQATVTVSTMLDAYARGDVATFNKRLADYRGVLAGYQQSLEENASAVAESGLKNAEVLSLPRVNFEVFFNQLSPFYLAAVLYLVAFVLGACSWLGWSGPLRRASLALLWFTFAFHTFALVSRIYISGRPPITNLYSTAIFIGWACVLLALVFEMFNRLGLGNIVAAVIGFLTLLVAHNLSLDGDTFIVLQAVLDTQFWLATHVVTINLGYATTYLAGTFGIAYVVFAHLLSVLDDNQRRQLTRMIYGTLCFAIFFSFVGTVLGGLWADDSWGRFWGWDPKENGALMIVLYNALVLHARWGGMVAGRGLALLAIGGNIVTTWSYFGTNELGVGLHSYGASDSSTAMWLLTFAVSQLAVIALGAVPAETWRRRRPATS
jgi:ABC-type transport system involved in cytochrome c biogenesis permease subunit